MTDRKDSSPDGATPSSTLTASLTKLAESGAISALTKNIRNARGRAARFYLTEKGINGLVRDWIETGIDEKDEVDQDIKDLAVLLEEVRAGAWRAGFDAAAPIHAKLAAEEAAKEKKP